MNYKWSFFIILLFVACESEHTIVDEKSFTETMLLKEKSIPVKALLNVDHFLVKNELLIVRNDRTDSIFMGINISSGNCEKAWGHKGQGPEEYLLPRLVNLSENNFDIIDFGRQNKIIVTLPNYDLKREPIGQNTDYPMNIKAIGNGRYIYDVIMPRQQDLKFWKIGEKPKLIYTFSDLKSKYKNSSVYQGVITANGNNNRIAYIYQYLRRFDILDFNGKLINTIEITPNQKAVLKNDGQVDETNSLVYYMGAKSTDKFIYLYYVGHTGAELRDNLSVVTYIEQYDWEGKPIKRYQINRFIFDFDIKSDKLFIGLDRYSENAPFFQLYY